MYQSAVFWCCLLGVFWHLGFDVSYLRRLHSSLLPGVAPLPAAVYCSVSGLFLKEVSKYLSLLSADLRDD